MAEEGKDSISDAGSSVRWLVGIPIAFLAGALAKLDWLRTFSTVARYVFLFAAVLFLVLIYLGISYAMQVTTVRRRKEALAEARTRDDKNEIKSAEDDLKGGNTKLARFHNSTFNMLILSGLFTSICLWLVLFGTPSKAESVCPAPQPGPVTSGEVTPGLYTLVNVPVQVRGRLSHSHTFLLNQKDGETWLMVCRTDKTVEFRRVRRLTLDGTLEAETTATSPALKGAEPK